MQWKELHHDNVNVHTLFPDQDIGEMHMHTREEGAIAREKRNGIDEKQLRNATDQLQQSHNRDGPDEALENRRTETSTRLDHRGTEETTGETVPLVLPEGFHAREKTHTQAV